MMKNNNTIMEIQIIKQGDFTLTHLVYCDIYSLLYKDSPIWGGDFNELFDTRLRDYIFEREPDPKKAVEFLNELHNWGFSQPGTLEKMLEADYGEEKIKILDEFHEEKQKILDEFHEEKIKILDEVYGEKI